VSDRHKRDGRESGHRGGAFGLLALALTVIVTAVGLYYWKSGRLPLSGSDQVVALPPPEPVAVTVGHSRVQDVAENFVGFGTLMPKQSVDISSRTDGHVDDIIFVEGSRIRKGDPVVKLDSRMVQAEVVAATAQLTTDKRQLTRISDLAGRGLQSTQSLEEVQAAAARSQSNLEVKQMQLDLLTIRAPFDGTLGKRKVSLGQYVTPGQPLVTLRDDTVLYIDLHVPEGLFNKVAVGQKFRVTLDALAGTSFEGAISYVNPSVEANNRTIEIRGDIPNGDGRLTPGLFAHVTLTLAEHPKAIVVPQEALVATLGGTFIYRVVDGKAVRTNVVVGSRQDGLAEIREGLGDGETVVSSGQFKIQNGQAVTIVAGSSGSGQTAPIQPDQAVNGKVQGKTTP
jgi:membrane fusion protein (multidrug efflux system)